MGIQPARVRQRSLILVIAAMLLFWMLQPPISTTAQTQSPNYWNYTTSAQLDIVISADVNDDGVAELLLATQNGKVDLLGSNGEFQWSYEANGPILALGTANVNGRSEPNREVVIALENRLVLLSDEGDLQWQVPIEPLTPPPALFTSGGSAAVRAWQQQYRAVPAQVAALDHDQDGAEEILVLLQSGQLQLFAADGSRIWTYDLYNNPLLDTSPHLMITDLDGNGRDEIILGTFNANRGFSRLLRLESNGSETWDRAVSGRITALTYGQFTRQGPIYLAVGTSLGNVELYDSSGQKEWPRTVNRTVTALTFAPFRGEQVLAVGTRNSSVIIFDQIGRRLWNSHLLDDAERSVISLSAVATVIEENDPALAAVLAPAADGDAAVLLLLSDNGRLLKNYTGLDTSSITRLLDINRDGKSELLLARFPNLELVGLGSGVSETAEEWAIGLDAVPESFLVIDFDRDGQDELLVGTNKGRLHRLSNDGSSDWILAPGGAVTHLAAYTPDSSATPQIAIARTLFTEEEGITSWVELRRDNGEKIWESSHTGAITVMQVGDLDGKGSPEIIIGTEVGNVVVLNETGSALWRSRIPATIRHLEIMHGRHAKETEQPELIVASDTEIYRIRENSSIVTRIASFNEGIVDVHVLQQLGDETTLRMLALVTDGTVYGLDWRGEVMPFWPISLGSALTNSIPAPRLVEDDIPPGSAASGEAFLVATETGNLVHLHVDNGRPVITWRMTGLGTVSSLYWGDLDGDALADIAIGDQRRRVQIFSQEPAFAAELSLPSNAFGLTTLQQGIAQVPDLTVVGENGLVQLFRAQENQPPLLFNPDTNMRQDLYGISVAVRDVEGDQVTVRLDVQDPNTRQWIPQEERRLTNGNGQLSFSVVNPPAAADGVHYRFHYRDPFHQGNIIPNPGPAPLTPPPLLSVSRTIIAVLTLVVGSTAVFLIRQSRSPTSRARRFHRRLQQEPHLTLHMLEQRYAYTDGSPSFLLYLTSQARQNGNWIVASLADGLFLLADRPRAALSILNSTLDEIAQRELGWQSLERWQRSYKTGLALLEAHSITELALLHPQLSELLIYLEHREAQSPPLEMLLPALTNIRDSERVELVEDRLVYLNEAASLLSLMAEQLPEFSEQIEKTLAKGIQDRWTGLVSARIEELRGRAELVITLKTRHLVPDSSCEVALEIENKGQAAAESIQATLIEMPAYQVLSQPQMIATIPSGRSRLIHFTIEPLVTDHFRLALTLRYSDRNKREKSMGFGDLIHLLDPVREFTPIVNPYIPGSPLRRDSALFYGRRAIFDFIAENIGQQAQRNVLILVGQRRTGKTSTLLQLEHHLPSHLYPIYIDCQSLGITSGMAALFNELAWLIADGLSGRDIDVEVPELEDWQSDPTAFFQRRFLPYVRSLLPPETTLLLVFDEFESFQSLVDDKIIPASFFPFLRHLMQHSEGLGFIFVGTHRLEEMGADYWSVLFNIALYQKIDYLSRASATRLITEPVAPALIYDDLALDKTLRVTAGHPYFLQLVCYTLVKRANAQQTGYVTISDVNAALDEMLRLGEVHFAYLWQRSTDTERAILTAVAHLLDNDLPFHPEDILDALHPYGIKLYPTEVTAALHNLVERDIMQETTEEGKTLYQLRIGLVGLWVAKNKSLSKLLYSATVPGPVPSVATN